MDFDLGAAIAQLFQGLRGTASAFSHQPEEFDRDLPSMMREGLRSRFAQPAQPQGIPGVSGARISNPRSEEDAGALRSGSVTAGIVRG